MSESTKIEGLVKTAMDKVREMADCETGLWASLSLPQMVLL